MSLQKNYISIKQQEAIRKVSLIIKKNLKKNKDISLSDHYYFNSWADNYGKRELIKLMNIKQTLFYKFYLNLKLIFGQSILEIDKYYINDSLVY